MKDKRSANQERAMLFAQQLRTRSGLSWQVLESEVGIGASKPGDTLRNWSNGRGKRVTMRDVQRRASVASSKGLLPPLREGLLRRKDILGSLDLKVNAEQAWMKEEKRLQALEKTQESSLRRLEVIVQALLNDEMMVAVDAGGNEIHAADLQAMIDKLRSISLHKIGH